MKGASILLAVVVSMLALVAAGCGGGDDSTTSAADEWANDFCTAITTCKDASAAALRNVSSVSRDEFEQAAEDVRQATSDLEDELRSLGAPETESGEAAKQAVDDFSSTVEADRADIETAVEGVSGITDLPGAVQDVTTSLASMNAALSSLLTTIDTEDAQDELKTAFENSDACDGVTG